MWLTRLKQLAVVAMVLILAIAGGAQGRQQAAPPAAGESAAEANQLIARKQLAEIDEAWDLLLRLAPSARINISDGQFGMWGCRRLETLHRAGASKAEIVAALENHIKDLKKLETLAVEMREASRATQVAVNETRYLRMEAEIWLNEEKAR